MAAIGTEVMDVGLGLPAQGEARLHNGELSKLGARSPIGTLFIIKRAHTSCSLSSFSFLCPINTPELPWKAVISYCERAPS